MTTLSEFRKHVTVLIAETRLLLRDPSGEKYSQARIIEALNLANLDWCLKSQLIKEEINIQLKEDVFEYDVKKMVEEDPTLRYYAFPFRVGYDGDDEPAMLPESLFRIDRAGYKRTDVLNPSLWYICAVSPGKIQIIGPPQQDGEP